MKEKHSDFDYFLNFFKGGSPLPEYSLSKLSQDQLGLFLVWISSTPDMRWPAVGNPGWLLFVLFPDNQPQWKGVFI